MDAADRDEGDKAVLALRLLQVIEKGEQADDCWCARRLDIGPPFVDRAAAVRGFGGGEGAAVHRRAGPTR